MAEEEVLKCFILFNGQGNIVGVAVWGLGEVKTIFTGATLLQGSGK